MVLLRSILPAVLTAGIFFSASAQETGFRIMEQKDKKQIDIRYNGRLLTAYCYYDSIKKPILFPVNTPDGITVTRGYPIAPRPGERTDHPHHMGIWMNYESVNGLDFWNHSTAIPFEKRNHYGTIVHRKVIHSSADQTGARLGTEADWVRPDGHVLLIENMVHRFTVQGPVLLIDRVSVLRARDTVTFRDVKDGYLAIRVARELEMPTQQADVFVDASGNETKVPAINNEGVTGMYLTSEGVRGDSAWGTKGSWTALHGRKEGKEITIALLDQPGNPGYPAYRHARGYGLFAINPFGRKIFSNGREEWNKVLLPGEQLVFHYRIIIASRQLDREELDQRAQEFEKEAGTPR
ncbi:MAG TPA: PmoA family protein [Chitinophagaceae bacterium]|jgi:hypothetical protein|nr:PmoA family protein [Chitinophagaceae bacterium]